MRGALAAFQTATTRSPTSIASTVAKLAPASPRATALSGDTTTVASEMQAAALGRNQLTVSSKKATTAPAEGSAVGSGGELGTTFSPTGDNDPSQIADTNSTAHVIGATMNAVGAAALPGAAEAGVATTATTASSPTRSRKPNARRFSTISLVVKSFPRNGNGTGERLLPGAEDRAAGDVAADATSPDGQQQAAGAMQPLELTPTQAAVLAADTKLEGLLNVGGILRAKSGWECPHGFPQGTPVWDCSTEGVVSSIGGAGGCGGVGGDMVGLARGGCVGGGGFDGDGGRGDAPAEEDVGKVVMRWASRFCDSNTGIAALDSAEGIRVGRSLARHVVRDGDAGLIGTRYATKQSPFDSLFPPCFPAL